MCCGGGGCFGGGFFFFFFFFDIGFNFGVGIDYSGGGWF